MFIGRTERLSGDWNLGGQNNGGTKNFVMGSLTFGATQQTVLRVTHVRRWDWWDRKFAIEKWIIHTKVVVGNPKCKTNLGDIGVDGEIRKDSVSIWTYALQIVLCSDQKIKCFCFVTSSPTAHSNKLFCFKLFSKFVLFVWSHFDLISVTWHAAAANLVTLWNTYRRQKFN